MLRWIRPLLALLVLAPTCLAQDPVPLLEAEVAPFPGPSQPLQAPVTTTVSIRVSCLLAEPDGRVVLTYAVADAPAWATVTLSPTEDALDASTCEGGYATREATLIASTSADAPAFQPATITVAVKAGSGPRERTVQPQVPFVAGYFSILDVALPETMAVVAPGEGHDFVLRVTNFGNGATTVVVDLEDATEGLTVALPDPIVLEARQTGATQVARDLVVRVTSRDASGFVNEVGVVNLRVTGQYAQDPSKSGDAQSVSLLVTTRTLAGGDDGEKSRIPAPGLALVLGALAVAARRLR